MKRSYESHNNNLSHNYKKTKSSSIDYHRMNSIYLCQHLKTVSNSDHNSLAAIAERAIDIMRGEPRYNFDARGLATIINMFSKKNYILSNSFYNNWEDIALKLINKFNSQELAMSIHAFGKLGIAPSDEFIKTWEKQAINFIDQFNSQDLANSISAFSILGIAPSAEFIKAWEYKAISEIFHFNPQELANSIYAFGKLGTTPSELFKKIWQGTVIDKIDKFDSQALVNTIHALNIMQIKISIPLKEALNKLALNNLCKEEVHQIWIAEQIERYFFRDRLLNEENYRIIEEKVELYKYDKPTISVLQKDIFNHISANKNIIYQTIEEESWIKEIAAPVDILITTMTGKKIIVQVDGPSHFIGNDHQYNSSTKFNTKILEKLGYMVIRIAYFEIHNGDFMSLEPLEHIEKLQHFEQLEGKLDKTGFDENFEHKDSLNLHLSGVTDFETAPLT